MRSSRVTGPLGPRSRRLLLSVGLFPFVEEYDLDPVQGLLTLARGNEIGFSIASYSG